MDYTQRLKWIENGFNADSPKLPPSLLKERMTGNRGASEALINLPLKHISLFRPEHYEPGYAYPLVIWLHPDSGSEQALHEIMPQISTRNYLGLSFRAPAIKPQAPSKGYYWPDSHLFVKQFAEQIQETVQELSKVLHIHEQRIYLAGTGSGCSVATKLLLQKPDFFAGAALFKGCFGKSDFQNVPNANLKNKRILLDHSLENASADAISATWVARMWQSTGGQIQSVNSLKAELSQETEQLAALNRWIMEGISTARLV
ncbi:alpha/beta hydrolase [Gimesia fumaroli]|uniref:Phospholipase/Carboxylesterase n=1 Tax=Gimesia fumaroli TaxID=2527976 RepID=A0A518IJ79_9PLAN|nr:hypothetical protein [Gimesia fumaroli]QDV53153.1 hypothetical protein Enr17x_52240 [Gimesia fumaroli]